MKKILFYCLGAALLMAAVLTSLVWFWLFRELPVLDAALSLPGEVALESTVSMTVTATNGHDVPVTLDSIDVDDAFLAGFRVLGIDPEPEGTTHIPIADQRSWSFGSVLQPGESMSVTFRLKPVAEGHFSGDVDVCNPNQDFTTLFADVVVTRDVSGQGAVEPAGELIEDDGQENR